MWYPGAEHKPLTVNYANGGCDPRIVIIHIMEGTLAGTDGWFRNPRSQVSAHFGVGRKGEVIQWVGTGNRAWHAADANSYAIGIECEGEVENPAEDSLTSEQVRAIGGIVAWAHKENSIPLWLNSRPYTGRGLSWHGLGGASWGNHPNCPGTHIRAQLPDILAAARKDAG